MATASIRTGGGTPAGGFPACESRTVRMAAARSRRKRPMEYSMLYTATLCMLAARSVMVYSASSAEALLQGPGDPAYYLKRYVACGLIGLVVMNLLSRHGLRLIRAATPVLQLSSFAL